jgi:hypothetical protein
MPAEVRIHMSTYDGPTEPEPLRPVEVTVQGVNVCFNGVPTLILVEPLPLSVVLHDPLTQQVASAYAHGYVHRVR